MRAGDATPGPICQEQACTAPCTATLLYGSMWKGAYQWRLGAQTLRGEVVGFVPKPRSPEAFDYQRLFTVPLTYGAVVSYGFETERHEFLGLRVSLVGRCACVATASAML